MGSKKFIIAGGIVAAVAAGAILVPSLVFGQPVAGVLSGSVVAGSALTQDADGHGQGMAWGRHKDSPDFPGQGNGLDKNSDDFPGHGKGLDNNSDDFPGQGKGLDNNSDDFPGQGKGLDKDHGNPHDETDD